jgi:RimJ/RimL family protein N-acetyltransferase
LEKAMTEPLITFVRLREVSIREVLDVLNEPRNGRHLPLAGERFTETTAAEWVAAKDGQWEMHGYGPWAVLLDGEFAGWGGFQHEENGADFALVLKPTHWGHGGAVTRAALNRGFSELGLETVLIALPYTRNPGRVVARFGFVPDGEVNYGGTTFRQYRLDRNAWLDRCSSSCGDTPRELV